MWTLFVYKGPIGSRRVLRKYDMVMVEADSVPHAECRFKEVMERSPLALVFCGFSAATQDEAWRKMREDVKRNPNLPRSLWVSAFRWNKGEEDPHTCSHRDHFLNRSPAALVLPKVLKEPGNSLRCTGCGDWHSWVDPNQPDGSYKCSGCRKHPYVGW